MSDPRRLPPHEAWDAVANMAIDDEARRLEGLSQEELDREVAATGRDPAAERTKGAALAARLLAERAARAGEGAGARAPADGPAVSRGPRSARRIWLLAAALALAVLLAFESSTIVAWLEGPTPAPTIGPTPEREPPPTQVAARARDEARDACQKEQWGLCARKLDEAKALDPAGETQPGVQALRSAIEEHTHLPDAWDPKGTRPR
jgi:hypothetical protein